MKIEMSLGKVKGLSLTLVAALFMQTAGAIWWVSGQARDKVFLENRVFKLETTLSKMAENTDQIHERLARIEERLKAQMVLLTRVERQILFPQTRQETDK